MLNESWTNTSLLEATVNLKIRFKGRVLQAVLILESQGIYFLLGSKQVQTANFATKHLLTFYSQTNAERPKFYFSKEQESVREHTGSSIQS